MRNSQTNLEKMFGSSGNNQNCQHGNDLHLNLHLIQKHPPLNESELSKYIDVFDVAVTTSAKTPDSLVFSHPRDNVNMFGYLVYL